MGGLKSRLTASLAAAWEAEMLSILALEKLAERASDARVRSRLAALAAGCQAHASRLLARMAAIGGGPLPVPPDDLDLAEQFPEALKDESARARNCAERYALMAALARKAMDPSAAWVCELNRAEELDRAVELDELAQRLAAGSEESFMAPPA
jgi:CO/xanthine dehydrogenase FAD-binding subunit